MISEMNLTVAEFSYIEDAVLVPSREISKRFEGAASPLARSDAEAGLSGYQSLVRAIRECATETIAAMVGIYIEKCRERGKFPDQDDVAKFGAVCKAVVMGKLQLFSRYRNDPFGEAIPDALAERIERSLADELEYNILPAGMQPLRTFRLEGEVAKENAPKDRDENDPESVMEIPLTERLLSTPDRLWLETLYAHQRKGEAVSDRAIEIELDGRLPKDFVRPAILGAFLREGGITILGVALLDPDNALVKDANEVISAVREILKKNPNQKQITAREIAALRQMDVRRVEELLDDIGHFRGFFHHSGVSAGKTGWSAINIREESTFRDYRKYENLQQVLEGLAAAEDEVHRPEPGPDPKKSGTEHSGRTIHVAGDYVEGTQIKSGHHVSGASGDRGSKITIGDTVNHAPTPKSWSREAKIGVVAIIVSIVIGATALMIPETRSFICEYTGALCPKPQQAGEGQ